jgi:alkylhydroperoxidase family enzyme
MAGYRMPSNVGLNGSGPHGAALPRTWGLLDSGMAWIQTTPKHKAQGALAELYGAVCDPNTGALDNIMAIHSLHPAGLEAHFALYRAVMKGSPSLRKVERELIALVVSHANGCHY